MQFLKLLERSLPEKVEVDSIIFTEKGNIYVNKKDGTLISVGGSGGSSGGGGASSMDYIEIVEELPNVANDGDIKIYVKDGYPLISVFYNNYWYSSGMIKHKVKGFVTAEMIKEANPQTDGLVLTVTQDESISDFTSYINVSHQIASATRWVYFDFTCDEGMLRIPWQVGTESGYDYGYVTIDGTTVLSKSGVGSGTHYMKIAAGTHKVGLGFKGDGSNWTNGNFFRIWGIEYLVLPTQVKSVEPPTGGDTEDPTPETPNTGTGSTSALVDNIRKVLLAYANELMGANLPDDTTIANIYNMINPNGSYKYELALNQALPAEVKLQGSAVAYPAESRVELTPGSSQKWGTLILPNVIQNLDYFEIEFSFRFNSSMSSYPADWIALSLCNTDDYVHSQWDAGDGFRIINRYYRYTGTNGLYVACPKTSLSEVKLANYTFTTTNGTEYRAKLIYKDCKISYTLNGVLCFEYEIDLSTFTTRNIALHNVCGGEYAKVSVTKFKYLEREISNEADGAIGQGLQVVTTLPENPAENDNYILAVPNKDPKLIAYIGAKWWQAKMSTFVDETN